MRATSRRTIHVLSVRCTGIVKGSVLDPGKSSLQDLDPCGLSLTEFYRHGARVCIAITGSNKPIWCLRHPTSPCCLELDIESVVLDSGLRQAHDAFVFVRDSP